MASFSWTYVNSTQSIIAISNSTTPICNTNVGTASSYAQAIPNGTYWWSVKSYDDAHKVWVNSSVSSFNISGNTVQTITGGVYGNVIDASTKKPIQGAVVTISNANFSEIVVTSSDGVYQFYDIPLNSGIYYISATATEFVGTSGLPINVGSTATRLDIPMTETPSYFAPSYTELIIVDSYLNRYGNSEIQIYADGNDPSNGNPNFDTFTDERGVGVFQLQQNARYTIQVWLNGKMVMVGYTGESLSMIRFVW